MRTWGNHRITTFQIIALGFVLMILIGTLLLTLPAAGREHTATAFSDCLFTATSAVCVTGLVVRDTAAQWSPFGQAVILCLIQIGGLGVVTAALSLAFISGRRIGLMQRSVMQESISAPQVGGIVKLTRFILLTTLCLELLGAVLLMPVFIPEFGWGKGIWYAVFHSVSAFCNAGFDLMGVHGAFSSMMAEYTCEHCAGAADHRRRHRVPGLERREGTPAAPEAVPPAEQDRPGRVRCHDPGSFPVDLPV